MNKNRILIADDAELNREMLSQMLGEQYDYTYARNGTEVIEKLSGNEEVDLILLDINMPEMDGFGVLRIMNERHWIEEFPVIVISAESGVDLITQAYQLGAVDYISRPFHTVVVCQRVENTLLMYSNQKRLIRLVEKQVYEREKINNSMINIFSNVIELRNHESGRHTLNVQSITSLLLHRLIEMTDRYGLTKSDVSLISLLSALHDIGKIKIPEEILNKPGKLTDEEWTLMKTHTTEGDHILSNSELDQNSKFIRTARAICRWHHEKYDGNGYPDGLVGDQIPIAAQIVSMADLYDALTNERCYKKAFPHEKAIGMLLGGECGAFNPLLLQCLTDISDSLREIAESSESYDYQNNAINTASEILADNYLPQDNALRRMLNNEYLKKNFFMECCRGIQFEYDKLLHRTTFVNPQSRNAMKRKVVLSSRDSEDNILPTEYWDALREKLMHTTREHPIAEMEVKLRINGELLPFHITAMAVWSERGTEYISVVGNFTPISTAAKES